MVADRQGRVRHHGLEQPGLQVDAQVLEALEGRQQGEGDGEQRHDGEQRGVAERRRHARPPVAPEALQAVADEAPEGEDGIPELRELNHRLLLVAARPWAPQAPAS